jgi:hypothetical protein
VPDTLDYSVLLPAEFEVFQIVAGMDGESGDLPAVITTELNRAIGPYEPVPGHVFQDILPRGITEIALK